ncbi:hypothetical protein [Hyphomonas chukchiensis]|uniref:Lipoprotein n=1 Tax=Hyphomonas chukchiensis TaxID=1280947 RepID=A0A062UMD2_9PROT|nr:hypothetical protein [Hyphomonas chukchiensis]KCZ60110.1 hypothetical protein HY30_12780 [Hyphomonas chukchiensis]|tara:strand:- start:340 stop:804 length:465 start_codon:yes stop_codon:yes gene_type:complete
MSRTRAAILLAGALLLASCGAAESPMKEMKTGQTAAEAKGNAPSARPVWLPDDIPLPDDLVIFETNRIKLPGDSSVSHRLKGYSWADMNAEAVTSGLREKILAAGYVSAGNEASVTPQLIQFSGNALAPGKIAFMQVDADGDHLVLSLSLSLPE